MKGFYLALIDRRASVGGSEGLADWPCVLGAVDNAPGGVWIDFIRRTVGDSQSIVAVPVTGSLVSHTLFRRRDADFSYRYSRFCVNCDTDWILPDSDILVRRTMDDSGRRGVWISDTPPATLTVQGFYLALIGCRASVGSSEGLADWPCMLGAVDNPPGGVWIDFIRRTVGDSQSIVVVPVTGSLVSPTLFSRRDADFSYRYSRFCVNCDMDWILPVGYRVLLLKHAAGGAMDADGFSIVDNRAGVTFGVDLYVPWDAPEMAIDLLSSGTVPLQNIPDVFGMSGHRDSATESRILQARDARSVRVRSRLPWSGPEFHNVTVTDMGDLPESQVSIPELSELARRWPPAVITHMRW